jgi:hypothetical protein
MISRRALRILKVAGIAIVALGVFGLVVKGLWNWLMPELFGVRQITYWQALGVWVLGRILFGNFHGRHNNGHWRARLIDRWERMSPEERAKLREGFQRRWGSYEEAERSS